MALVVALAAPLATAGGVGIDDFKKSDQPNTPTNAGESKKNQQSESEPGHIAGGQRDVNVR